jgi:hypothetical protein
MGLASLAVLIVAMGLAVGSFSLTVNHIFRKRTTTTFQVLCRRPGWSLLAGIAITLLGLGLMAVLRGAGPVALLVLLGYLLGLLLFAIAAATRLAGRILDPASLDDELPDARLLLKAGLLLLAVNIVPFIGTMLFFGILLAAVGAALLGYFAKLGGTLRAAAAPAGAPAGPAPAPVAAPTPPPPPPAPTAPQAQATAAPAPAAPGPAEPPAGPAGSDGSATPS